jgi:hypothetical protein
MLRATMDCLEKGQAPTAANRARVLGRRRQSVWEFDKRHPDFHAWQDSVLRAASSTKWGLVKSRTADLAMQGSPTHAEIYCRMESGHYDRPVGSSNPVPPGDFKMTFLIPRPDYPIPGAMHLPASAPATRDEVERQPAPARHVPRPPLPGDAIPTIAVRRGTGS